LLVLTSGIFWNQTVGPDAVRIDEIGGPFSSLFLDVPERGSPERAQYRGIVGVDADFKVSRSHSGSVASHSAL
jgi:hypothetical protein